jgi:hypothetical protein
MRWRDKEFVSEWYFRITNGRSICHSGHRVDPYMYQVPSTWHNRDRAKTGIGPNFGKISKHNSHVHITWRLVNKFQSSRRVKSLPRRCRFRFSSPDQASRHLVLRTAASWARRMSWRCGLGTQVVFLCLATPSSFLPSLDLLS